MNQTQIQIKRLTVAIAVAGVSTTFAAAVMFTLVMDPQKTMTNIVGMVIVPVATILLIVGFDLISKESFMVKSFRLLVVTGSCAVIYALAGGVRMFWAIAEGHTDYMSIVPPLIILLAAIGCGLGSVLIASIGGEDWKINL